MRSRSLLALLAVAAVAACSTGQHNAAAPMHGTSVSAPPAAGAALASAGCPAAPPVSPLPVWARSGFHPPDTPMPHVMGADGNIVAILWAPRDALHAPPLTSPANKILWVSRLTVRPGAPFRIEARLDGTSRTAAVVLPYGPGPSYVDLPAPGCWTLNLSWSGHHDQVRLRYVAS